ncbi:AAA family ATPase [Faecalicoccus acidiformans]|uniref:AAA family ATPase n=1 Tax=Faecalicoccus acidiformans TaxID=915173 RepID=UPI00235761E6|nr:AAA family ATPase [Faecalicoccus acidiformans]
MFLKRIEIQGFKSFADKTILQFDQNITGIVGPNGCGKSNVNDAIRWVLGEQSTKSLRSGSSMSDIIFSGSEYRKPVNMAKVTLVFDNSLHIFDSPYEEIEITRQLQRSTNEASYFINKEPCRLKDINDLVMDTGLGRDSLSIITQGNISAFADAKPEDRRLLFEEAAGVAKYKKRKKVSLQKLEKTKDNLDRLQDILDELEKQLSPLEKQAEKAKIYKNLKTELSSIEISVLVEEIESMHREIEDLSHALFEAKTIYTSKEASLNQQEIDISNYRQEMHALDRQINDLQGQYTRAMEDSYRLEKQKVELDEKRKYRLLQADALARQDELKQMLQEAKYEFEDRQKRLQILKADLEMHLKRLNDLKNKENQASMQASQQRHVLQELKNRKQVLENIARQPFSHQQSVRAVLDARHSLMGIEGVVSELLKAQPEHAKAIESALQGSLYHIVTKDEAAARNAIGYLKKNKSGRATFLPLNIMKKRFAAQDQQIIASQSEGMICWAYECVSCAPKYEDLRDRLLGNVLVMDNLVHANECAKRLQYRVKIVTLDGDIVHTGGSMTGGSIRNQTSLITIQHELDSIRSQIEGQELKVSHDNDECRMLENQMDKETETCMQLQIDVAKLENIYLTKKEKYDSLQMEYKDLVIDEEKQDLEEDDIVVLMSKMHARIDQITGDMQALRKRRYDKGNTVEQMENQMRSIRREMNVLQVDIHDNELEQAKKQAYLDTALRQLNSEYSMTFEHAKDQKQDIDLSEAKQRVQVLRTEISKLGNVNPDAPDQYKEIKERFDFMTSQKEDLERASASILSAIDEMDQTMKVQFVDMFEKINQELDGIFKAMFGGGKAKLSMVDPEDVLNTGIEIDVQPPGKMVKNLQSFSGGEKALIAISVLFAILQARVMPLCIFDEVEAALDQANVERFARYLSRFGDRSQFIVVTHRPGTMEQCDTLYGITMQKDGVSKLLKVQLKDAVHIVENKEVN